MPRCVLCQDELRYLGAGNVAKPFWSVAHQFFAYALKPPSLVMLATIAFVSLFFFGTGAYGLGALLFAAAVVIKFGFAVLERVASGKSEPPSVNEAVGGDESHLFLKFFGLVAVVGFLVAAANEFGGQTFGTIVSMTFTLFAPAMIIYLAIERSITSALDPARLLRLTFSIGLPYLLVVFLTNVISTGPFMIVAAFYEFFTESSFATPLFTVLIGYFAVVNFAMLGYVLFENQSELGYIAGDPLDNAWPENAESERRRTFAEANVLAKEGRTTEALARFGNPSGELATDPVYLDRHFALANELRDEPAVKEAANRYINYLADHNAADQALDVWRLARKGVSTFKPNDAERCHELARHAFGKNLETEALALLANLHKQWPGYARLEEAYQLAIEILESRGDAKQAARITRFLAERPSETDATTATQSTSEPAKLASKDSGPESWALLE